MKSEVKSLAEDLVAVLECASRYKNPRPPSSFANVSPHVDPRS
jgi:hypothetical protein